MTNSTREMKNPTGPVTKGQAYYLLSLVGRKAGFQGFVPEWSEITGDEKASVKAARLLTEAGATKTTASDAVSYLKASKPSTPAGEEKRRREGLGRLYGHMTKIIPAKKEELGVAPASLEGLMATIAALQEEMAKLQK